MQPWGLRADSFGPCLGTWSFSARRPLPWLLSHGSPPSYPSFFPNRSKGEVESSGSGRSCPGRQTVWSPSLQSRPQRESPGTIHLCLAVGSLRAWVGLEEQASRAALVCAGPDREQLISLLSTAKAWSYNLDTRHAQRFLAQAGRHFGYQVLQVGDG